MRAEHAERSLTQSTQVSSEVVQGPACGSGIAQRVLYSGHGEAHCTGRRGWSWGWRMGDGMHMMSSSRRRGRHWAARGHIGAGVMSLGS